MADYTDPHNTAIKPSLDSLEGKIALAITVLTSVSAAAGVVIAAYPNNEHVKIAALVLAVLMAGLGAFISKGHSETRADMKQTANIVAGSLAMADKAVAIAKENPDLAREILKGAGISLPVPTPPAST